MTTSARTSVFLPLALLAVVGTVLAGCSATGTASAGSSGEPSARASAPAASPSTASSAAADSGDGICQFVSVAAANSATHLSPAFTDQRSGTFVDGEPECGFTNDDQSVIVNVTVFDSSKNPFDANAPIMGADTFHSLSGVGDRAAIGSFELDAAIGSKVLVVENVSEGPFTPDQLVAMAKLFAPHIH